MHLVRQLKRQLVQPQGAARKSDGASFVSADDMLLADERLVAVLAVAAHQGQVAQRMEPGLLDVFPFRPLRFLPLG